MLQPEVLRGLHDVSGAAHPDTLHALLVAGKERWAAGDRGAAVNFVREATAGWEKIGYPTKAPLRLFPSSKALQNLHFRKFASGWSSDLVENFEEAARKFLHGPCISKAFFDGAKDSEPFFIHSFPRVGEGDRVLPRARPDSRRSPSCARPGAARGGAGFAAALRVRGLESVGDRGRGPGAGAASGSAVGDATGWGRYSASIADDATGRGR